MGTVTYSLITGSTGSCGNKYVTGWPSDTLTNTRFFTKFLMTGYGLTVAKIISIKYYVKVTTITGLDSGFPYILRSSQTGWGSTLEGNQADYQSTSNNIESSNWLIDSTGWHYCLCNKNNFNLAGYTYLRIATSLELSGYSRVLNIATYESGNKPYLEILTRGGQKFRIYSIGG